MKFKASAANHPFFLLTNQPILNNLYIDLTKMTDF